MSNAIKDLLSSDVGIMSVAVITAIIVMGSYIAWFVRKHVREEEAAQAAKQGRN
ncbi:DUF3149 domain-containing protein [Chitinimonas sp. JJ19]|uniref:DUF3149 domain-containing protein n=1 Tax=Chitinimonas sp. JJ19 TaxID=3109352 RepID=UPI001A56279F|nr:DUF3149 domain-containing protein [Chitinimonas sp.]